MRTVAPVMSACNYTTNIHCIIVPLSFGFSVCPALRLMSRRFFGHSRLLFFPCAEKERGINFPELFPRPSMFHCELPELRSFGLPASWSYRSFFSPHLCSS